MHVPEEFPVECVKRLVELVKQKKFDGEFVGEVLVLAAWAISKFWQSPPPDGVTGAFDVSENYKFPSFGAYSALFDLSEALGEDPPIQGPVTNEIMLGLMRRVVELLIKKIEEQPSSVILDVAKEVLTAVLELLQ